MLFQVQRILATTQRTANIPTLAIGTSTMTPGNTHHTGHLALTLYNYLIRHT